MTSADLRVVIAKPKHARIVAFIVNRAYHRVEGLAEFEEKPLEAERRIRDQTVLLFCTSEATVATVSYCPLPDEPTCALVSRFAVDPQSQRKGYGAAAFRTLTARLRYEGYTTAVGRSLDVMDRAHKLYAAHGVQSQERHRIRTLSLKL